MPDSFDIGYIIFVCGVLICFTGFYIWYWRGRFLPGQPIGFRLEEHRRQAWGAIRMSLFPLGLLALNAADRALDLCHLSHTRHAFWSGMLVASDLWLLVFMIPNVAAAIRRFQDGRAATRRPDLRHHA